MARHDAERDAQEESEGAKPSVGTDPMRSPEEQHSEHHRVVSPDEEKVEEAQDDETERGETEEERAERVKNA